MDRPLPSEMTRSIIRSNIGITLAIHDGQLFMKFCGRIFVSLLINDSTCIYMMYSISNPSNTPQQKCPRRCEPFNNTKMQVSMQKSLLILPNGRQFFPPFRLSFHWWRYNRKNAGNDFWGPSNLWLSVVNWHPKVRSKENDYNQIISKRTDQQFAIQFRVK